MNDLTSTELLQAIKWDERGLVPAICQDADSGEVLMMAWMNRESLGVTLERGVACYWSRSRGKLWLKGESSGHTQRVIDLRLDCDGDCLLLRVKQEGPACHTGHRSCFYRGREGSEWKPTGERLLTQAEMDAKYGKVS